MKDILKNAFFIAQGGAMTASVCCYKDNTTAAGALLLIGVAFAVAAGHLTNKSNEELEYLRRRDHENDTCRIPADHLYADDEGDVPKATYSRNPYAAPVSTADNV